MNQNWKFSSSHGTGSAAKGFSPLISNNIHNPSSLFNTVAKLIQKQLPVSCSAFMAHGLFCVEPQIDSGLTADSLFLEMLSPLMLTSKPTACLVNPLPAKPLKDLWHFSDPQCKILMICHWHLALFQLRLLWLNFYLKKTHLDPGSLNNYRPVCNLPLFQKY